VNRHCSAPMTVAVVLSTLAACAAAGYAVATYLFDKITEPRSTP